MTDIVEFLTARLDEDEVAAKAATPGPWKTDDPLMSDHVGSVVLKDYVASCSVRSGYRENSIQDAAHIARHDPARVLREVAARRRVMERHTAGWKKTGACLGCNYGPQEDEFTEDIEKCPELCDMASVYDEHPDYKQSWSVE